MVAVVKKPRTKKPTLKVEGNIPFWMISRMKKEYGKNLIIKEEYEKEEEYVDLFSTAWHKKTENETSAGDTIKMYRENAGLTQEDLGNKLGKVPRQNVSAMEKGRRGISKDIARKLANIFKVPIDRFI
ncbi:MAG: helix-turn-helix domain-containing protein [Chitinivibrionales bacterium]|nr:helix-turn-helix domain-containing protein [Chitinivibrionales bacterium]